MGLRYLGTMKATLLIGLLNVVEGQVCLNLLPSKFLLQTIRRDGLFFLMEGVDFMGSGILSNPMLNLILKGLDAVSLRQRTIAHNMANADTPRFKRSVVSFEEKLAAFLQKTNGEQTSRTSGKHFRISGTQSIEPEIKKISTGAQRQDGNNVNMDVELSQMMMNTIIYSALIQQTTDRLDSLRYVINEGRW